MKSLGKVDAAVECTELALREFIAEGLKHPEPFHYIQKLSSKHGIKVDHVNLKHLQVRAAQLYLIATYQQAEGFLESFRDEHPLADNWKYDKEGDDLLKRILRNIGGTYQLARKLVGALEVDLFDYYRHMRNRFVHPLIDEAANDKKASRLQEAINLEPKYAKLQAPNVYHEITFDDFVLFTRIIKHIAYKLCTVSRPADQEIASTVIKMIQSGQTSIKLQTIKKLGNNPERLHRALTSYLRELYGLDKEEADPIVHLIQNAPLA